MQEINNGRRCRAETFDLRRGELLHLTNHLILTGCRQACLQERRELLLVRLVLVDVGNAQLRFPEKRVGRAFKNLLLLGDRRQHDFERRTFEIVPEPPADNRVNRVTHAAADRAEGFHPFLAADEPSIINRFGIAFIAVDQIDQSRRLHYRSEQTIPSREPPTESAYLLPIYCRDIGLRVRHRSLV